MNASITITDMQRKTILIKPVNAVHDPAPVKGVPAFSVDIEGICSAFPADDGSSFEVTSIKAGVAVISMVETSLGGIAITTTLTVTIVVDPRKAAATEMTDVILDTSIPAVDK